MLKPVPATLTTNGMKSPQAASGHSALCGTRLSVGIVFLLALRLPRRAKPEVDQADDYQNACRDSPDCGRLQISDHSHAPLSDGLVKP